MEECVLQRQYRNMKNKECHKAAVLALHVRVACGCIHDAHAKWRYIRRPINCRLGGGAGIIIRISVLLEG